MGTTGSKLVPVKVPTIYCDADCVAPLLGWRLTPVEGAVRLLSCLKVTARGSEFAPVSPTAGNLVSVGGEPLDAPSLRRAVVAAAQRERLILKELRRVWTHDERHRLGDIWGQRRTFSQWNDFLKDNWCLMKTKS